MFSKSYKLKSTNTLKNTEKKHLAQRILDSFSAATDEKVKELVSVKSNTSCLKLMLHSDETVAVYAVEGVPIMIDISNMLVPTVCALWKVPDLIPTITIQAPVLSKIAGGAPLYLPGVILPSGGIGFPMFAIGAPIAARTSNNAAAALVGRATLSSGDMLLRAGGMVLDTIHVIGDLLCKDPKFTKIERPKLGAPSSFQDASTESIIADIGQLNIRPSVREEWPSLGKPEPRPAPALNEPKIISEIPQDAGQIDTDNVDRVHETTLEDSIMEDSQMEEDGVPSDMDGLLQWCLLGFLKTEGKRIELPLKTNLFYKNNLMPLCPPDRSLDVKKSSYKKMSKFLEAMQKEALLEVHELEKGVDAITAINLMHPLVRAHRPLAAPCAAPGDPAGGEYSPPHVAEMYCVTANVAQLFAPVKKGTPLTLSDVRTTLTEYVKSRNLNSTTNKGCVILDLLLSKITGQSEHDSVKWDVLMSSVQNKMTACTQMRFADGGVTLTKTKLEPVKMQVASRSGNKKVTLVSNLESFGFSLQELSRVCQHGVAASCGVTRTPGAKSDQLMLQGDQTHFVAKLLIEKYGLPKKYVDGADKALKKKK